MCLIYGKTMKCILLVCFAHFIFTPVVLGASNLVVVILSQPDTYHDALASKLKSNILDQAQEPLVIYLSHVDFPLVGSWAVTPLIPHLVQQHTDACLWFLFIEYNTQVKLDKLKSTLQKYNCSEEVWFGYALHDAEPTIIHHFSIVDNSSPFKYPNSASGFVISGSLMRSLATRLVTHVLHPDFSIDYTFELALFIWNNGEGITLTHEPTFCNTKRELCSTFPQRFKPCRQTISKESIYFAVKTCRKFHGTRVPVVQNTWGAKTQYIGFFSDVADSSIPTISLGIPNTERGHCVKTFEIIKYVANNMTTLSTIKWIMIADDDTILSVSRLGEVLSCYDSIAAVALGERYGYNIHSTQGYNYITGGGGIVLSRALVKILAETKSCDCPSLSSPDDMFLGVCLARLGIAVTHSPVFHQARPVDYAPEYLQQHHVVSFHKHWNIDPFDVYKKWFGDDLKSHTEL